MLLASLLASAAFALPTAPVNIPVLAQLPRSDWLSVKEVGAVGDGSRDDSVAIQRAFRMLTNRTSGLVAGKKDFLVIYFPPGDYLISRTLELGSNKTGNKSDATGGTGGLSSVALIGHGAATTLRWGGALNGTMLWSNGCTRCRAEGITFDGRGVAGVGIDHRSYRCVMGCLKRVIYCEFRLKWPLFKYFFSGLKKRPFQQKFAESLKSDELTYTNA